MLFAIIFFYYIFLPIRKKLMNFNKWWFIFWGRTFSTTLLFPMLKVNFCIAETVKKNLKRKKFSNK